jgi:hypothetical protein
MLEGPLSFVREDVMRAAVLGAARALDVALAHERLRALFPTAETAGEALKQAGIDEHSFPADPARFSHGDLARLRKQGWAAIAGRLHTQRSEGGSLRPQAKGNEDGNTGRYPEINRGDFRTLATRAGTAT